MTEIDAAPELNSAGKFSLQIQAPSYSKAAPAIFCLPQLQADILT